MAPVFRAVPEALQITLTLSILAVAARVFISNRWIANAVAVIAMTAVAAPGTAIGAGFLVVEFGAMLALLTRSGLVSLGAAYFVLNLSSMARATDWAAWHARPTIFIMVVIAALAVYAAWAATAGWSRPDPEESAG